MRGRRRKPRISRTRIPGEPTEARERLERAWFRRMRRESELAPLVTARDARNEPFHRWLVFKQAFSPGLVRRFLRQNGLDADAKTPWLLDPFAGTGTFVTECARQRIRAIGLDPLLAPAFVTRCKSARDVPDPPDLGGCNTWQDIAPRLTIPIHRAALICAVASQLTALGKLDKNAEPITEAFSAVLAMMREDVRDPLPVANPVLPGDGRTLDFIADHSIGGLLTSPPYLSRHDYTRITRGFEDVYACWDHLPKVNQCRRVQLPAHPGAKRTAGAGPQSAGVAGSAVNEAAAVLDGIGEARLARVLRDYFAGLSQALDALGRVLAPRAPCWIIIAGARLKDVYIPSDTILAELARQAGFDVTDLRVARNVIPSGRRFGTLTNVSPRESIIVMQSGGVGRRG